MQDIAAAADFLAVDTTNDLAATKAPDGGICTERNLGFPGQGWLRRFFQFLFIGKVSTPICKHADRKMFYDVCSIYVEV